MKDKENCYTAYNERLLIVEYLQKETEEDVRYNTNNYYLQYEHQKPLNCIRENPTRPNIIRTAIWRSAMNTRVSTHV